MSIFTPRTMGEDLNKERSKWRKRRRLIYVGAGLLVVIVIGVFLYQASNVLTIAGNTDSEVGIYKDFKVEKEPNRIDVLVLGIRGSGESHGGSLADTMLLFSFDTEKKKASMTSIPRDLYVDMPDHHQPEKINYAYALGESRKPGGGGLALSKEVVKYVTGVYVDHAVVVNFKGFEEVVDIMGGVEIYRDTDFYETQQWQGEGDPNSPYWYKTTKEIVVDDSSNTGTTQEESSVDPNSEDAGTENETPNDNEEQEAEEEKPIQEPPKKTIQQEYWVFHVPKGYSVLDGKEALYYVRSRYSSSDFDRARRQQQVIESLKNKALSLGVLGNPLKVFEIMDAVGNNVKTDMSLGDIRSLVSLAYKNNSTEISSIVLDTSQEGLLRSTVNSRGQYILLPRSGNFDEIRNRVKNIFEQ